MTPLCRKDDSLLLCVDIQERLYSTMPDPARGRMLDNTIILLETCKLLNIPVMYSEQYPTGLGETVADIQDELPADAVYFNKTSFSCCGAEGFTETLRDAHKRQVIIVGMESHICVMQTAIDLQSEGYEVFVVDDAVCSQRMANWKSALNRLRQTGIVAAPTQSVLFEWLRDSNHEHFKSISVMLRH